MKICSGCKVEKDVSEFSLSTQRGLQSYCRACSAQRKREWVVKNREKKKWNTIWTKYRLRQADYEALLAEQNGLCRLCDEIPEVFQIDHCHATGRVRGLLCTPCNMFVGWIETRGHLLDKVEMYLAPSVRI